MTTKNNIIAGFLIMILLAGAIAFIGYRSLQEFMDSLNAYKRVSELNVALSDLEKNLYSTVYNIERFMSSRDPAMMDRSGESFNEASKHLANALVLVQLPERRRALEQAATGMRNSRELLDKIRNGTLKAYAQYVDVCRPNLDKMRDILMLIANTARRTGNTEAIYYVANSWEQMFYAGTSMNSYIQSRNPEEAAATLAAFKTVDKALEDMKAVMTSEAGRRDYTVLLDSFANVKNGFTELQSLNISASRAIAELRASFTEMLAGTAQLSSSVNTSATQYAEQAMTSGSSAQRQMLVVSLAGTLFGLGLAIFLILRLSRMLKGMAGYVDDVSRGEFRTSFLVKERGELGMMFEAIHKIPAVLTDIVSKCNELANGISSGRFRQRLELSGFEGEFARLASAVNVVGDSYTGVFDNLPVSIQTVNSDMRFEFLNKSAQGLVGGDKVGGSCAQHMKTQQCNTEQCFGRRSVSGKTSTSGEIFMTAPDGRRVDVSVTCMPLYNVGGKIVGSMEILSDISEIKKQQQTILGVAKQASEIADRVAAAAEELSAQVEKVSRGAEMQRDRVESTASAMTQMNSTVLEVARSASQASEQSENTRNNARSGATLVNQVVESINNINKAATRLQDNMHELGAKAENIGGVMNVISDIADQTNLLALNAAIEAARAGEAGRGFAVVADEVRKLAEKTMSATHEVGENISSIQSSARQNIDEVGEAVENITKATALANSSGQALDEIVELASATSGVVTAIATAAEEQSATSEQITSAVDEINRVVAESAEGMIQASEAVQDLAATAQQLRRVMDNIS